LLALGLFLGVSEQAKADFNVTTLDVPGSVILNPNGINNSGQIVGTYDDAGSTRHGYLRMSDGSYTTLDVPGATATVASGINDAGEIVGNYKAGGPNHGFLLSGGNYTTLDVPGSIRTFARGINSSRQIVGFYDDAAGTTHGFLLSDGSYTAIDPPGSTLTFAFKLNASGQIVGSYTDVAGKTHGYLRMTDGSYTTLDMPGSTATWAGGINDAGQIVGTHFDDAGISHLFLLSGGRYTTLDFPGSTATHGWAINARGQIVGQYTDADGTNHDFLATPPLFLIMAAPTAVAGTPFDIIVTALDAQGNIDTGYQGTVTFTSSDAYPGLLPADYTFTSADQGTHTFSGVVTFFTAGAQMLTAQDTADSSLTGSATVSVVAAPASQLLITGPANAVSGTPFDVILTALDPYANVDMNYAGTVTWTSSDTDPGVILLANYTFQPTDNGMVTFPGGVTLITLGNQTLTSTDTGSGITGSATITVGPGP
jgi:probable HAF family extracellular repeat protein